MLRNLRALQDYAIRATDGDIGMQHYFWNSWYFGWGCFRGLASSSCFSPAWVTGDTPMRPTGNTAYPRRKMHSTYSMMPAVKSLVKNLPA